MERALAANAAHELRTPLAAARLRLQTALEHDLQRNDVQAALDALRTLSHRTEKLLQLSRAESGASLARTRVDLVQLAGTVAQEFWQDPQRAERLVAQGTRQRRATGASATSMRSRSPCATWWRTRCATAAAAWSSR